MVDARAQLLHRVRQHLGLTRRGPFGRVAADQIDRFLAGRRLAAAETLERLDGDPALLQALVESVLVGETYFLREPKRLRHLVEDALPALLGQRPEGHVLRCWSAGCSTGEEPYSLALLLRDTGVERAHVLASDVSAAALSIAADATYSRWSFRDVEPALHASHLERQGERFRVSDELRGMVTFTQHNLVADPYPSGYDLILCRNVLVYLNPMAQREVARRLATALAPGGWLMTAVTDPLLHQVPGLEQVRAPGGLLYRRPAAAGGPAPGPPRGHGRAQRASARGARTTAPKPSRRDAPAPPHAADAAIATPPHGEILALLGRRSLAAAEAHASAAVAAAPLDAEARHLQAVVALESGRLHDAVTAATSACYLAPDHAAAHVVLGHAHHALGDHGRATRSWQRARDLLGAVHADEPVGPMGETAGRLLGLLDAVALAATAGSSR